MEYIKTSALVSKDSSKDIWRWYRNYLQMIACTVNIYSDEYKNLRKRINWINDNRL